MTTLATEISRPASPSSLARTAVIAAAILLVFGAYSAWVIAGHGLLGFLTLAGREPWAMQMLLDLALACSFGFAWMRADARRRGLASWPFLPLIVAAGSVGLLAYVVYRAFAART
jgi:hypothetical protein